MTDDTHLVAVYGSLKRTGRANGFLKNSTFIGTGLTLKNYKMASSGFPVIVPDENGHRVLVEIYRISNETLSQLDYYEGHPRLYLRERRPVQFGSEIFTAFLYEGNLAKSMLRPENMVEPNEEGILCWRG